MAAVKYLAGILGVAMLFVSKILIIVLIMLIIPLVWFLGIKGMTFPNFWEMIVRYFGGGVDNERQDG